MINELEEIKALYDEFYLIDEPLKNEVKESENPTKINFAGGNKTGLVFVFGNPLSEADKEMIYNLIHKAMKLTMEDIAWIDCNDVKGVTVEQMINVMNARKVIVWGAPEWVPSGVKTVNFYQISTFQHCSLLHVDSVPKFLNDIPLKTTLWNAIQLLVKTQ
jgi:hypothetical protein